MLYDYQNIGCYKYHGGLIAAEHTRGALTTFPKMTQLSIQ